MPCYVCYTNVATYDIINSRKLYISLSAYSLTSFVLRTEHGTFYRCRVSTRPVVSIIILQL